MSFGQAVRSCWNKYFDFSGRAIRSEYWWWQLFVFIGSIIFTIFDGALGLGILSLLFSLAVLLPSWAVGVRRLHDIDKSGWWLLLNYLGIPVLFAAVVVLAFIPDDELFVGKNLGVYVVLVMGSLLLLGLLIMFLIWYVRPGTDGENRFGLNPLATTSASVLENEDLASGRRETGSSTCYCPDCGAENSTEGRFCRKCGGNLPQVMP